MASIFSKIVAGEIPCHKIAETDKYLAFLDAHPMRRGHTLCIPKQEIDYIFDIDDELLSGLMVFAKKVAKSLKEVVPCTRIGIGVIGLEVPHAHIHLVPMNQMSDMNFKNKVEIAPEEMSALAADIAAKFDEA